MHAVVLSGSCSVEQVNEADTAHGSVMGCVLPCDVCTSACCMQLCGVSSLCMFLISVSPVISVSVPLCAVVPPCQAGLLLQRVHPRQPSAGLLHHAACATQFGAARTAAASSREG